MLSVIIPAYKDPYLQKTIDSLLENAEGDIEIIAVLDGYWPNPELRKDPRLNLIHSEERRGMRSSINAGVELASGEYIMKTDAHCLFGKGFDRLLLETMYDDWVVIPRRYKLDVEKWEVMDDPPVDYDKLVIMESRNKFHAQEWISRTKARKTVEIDETMSFQGSCWVMSKKHWNRAIRGLQEHGYGTFLQEAIEIGMKTWQSGGKVMINKKTWYAHKHRMFKRTHNIKRAEADPANKYALERWMDEYQKLRQRFGI